ncbi:hypothetical protein [Aquimarina sp. MMG016]|uniref:hypothetical protein n=1 Tax=Aquimarina sp. MMG016 TaxID=2822690 RepID=UPI001B39ED89|nr:hypothetical protein [Aquimarina sp. MMG016]MBQ4822706.1 hypothetical protein [Aquimarina sp. MMG016]
MPHKIRSRVIFVLYLLLFSSIAHAQTNDICFSIDETGIIKRAYASFEKDIFNHYKFGNDSIKTYRTFLAEVASLSIDLRKLPSDNSIQLTREFKKIANNKNSLWVRLTDYENQEANRKPYPSSTTKKNEEEILIFNYRGGFIQCLKNTSDSDDFKEVIRNLETDANISTSLIAQKIYYISDKEFNSLEIKNFIAFDIYYSILMVVEKAFK